MDTVVEQRTEPRTELTWPLSMWLPQCNKFFNARTANISSGGLLAKMPVTTPVKEGSIVEVNLPRTDALAREKGGYARIKTGRIVRVERSQMLKDASIGVAVKFE